ncbi:nitrogen fixation protein FixG (homologous to rdxB), with 4Fe-4S ferredoxin, iron-sulfur binding domain [Bradyrhizobium oligotrophicum S58]|uniref:Nitrogen fixation protein FixG (Homologous to rdxB), with 4Fe-4S ferredoxin, iron-sulfur binding domain n=1 Tax=Bradyrhizobium oligotrophicum S58 TaxID=1245469 RepID=M4Z9U8_9BRAD|nr:cytochrome c oxidase accessory protein CcoG [Bradyrhizobium oligotrophicum]BAM90282.1 nitrogen fixation protein FixG (homologous to rdxB), with 4Fe-4S ferredoxin, iron-sulfur binding domain [Bradyrhizobium oligotrophicum S58]
MADQDETYIVGPLYKARDKVYPAAVHGRFRRIKWTILCITLGIYYLLPFVRWDRGPGMPNQAVLVDFPHRRFYFFFIELWPQEVYYFTGLLIIAAVALFLMNAVAGRLWCGYLCPQTVWTDLFYAVERWVEGDRRERILSDKRGWTFTHIRQVALKHFLWIMIGWWTGGAWVLYFDDAPTLVKDLATFQAPFTAYLWIGILTATTYVFAGHAREQVCIYMCPWPRIQAALTDEWALNVTYKGDRGEPRMSVKKADAARLQGEPAGDCVDCHQCINVCPTGVDIRHGIQLGCIQCSLCIDACDSVMTQIGRPTGLIGYDTDINVQRRREGKPEIYRIIRPRTIIYASFIAIVGGIMLYSLATRGTMGINVLHERNPLFVQLSDGGVRNDYTVRLLNKRGARDFVLDVVGLPNAKVTVAGETREQDGRMMIDVGQDQTREIRMSIEAKDDNIPPAPVDIEIRITDPATGTSVSKHDHFVPPTR